MKVFRVDEIKLGPVDIIAKDSDQAAGIFITALLDGLVRYPGADFAISAWTAKRLKRHKRLRKWTEEGRAGVVWPSRDGYDWEHVAYDEDDD